LNPAAVRTATALAWVCGEKVICGWSLNTEPKGVIPASRKHSLARRTTSPMSSAPGTKAKWIIGNMPFRRDLYWLNSIPASFKSRLFRYLSRIDVYASQKPPPVYSGRRRAVEPCRSKAFSDCGLSKVAVEVSCPLGKCGHSIRAPRFGIFIGWPRYRKTCFRNSSNSKT
jgi:hypothetical protein